MAVILYHAEHRDRKPRLLQHPNGHLGVVFATVDEKEVGQVAELFISVQIAPKPPGEDLLHGAVIVGVDHILELEVAVIPL